MKRLQRWGLYLTENLWGVAKEGASLLECAQGLQLHCLMYQLYDLGLEIDPQVSILSSILQRLQPLFYRDKGLNHVIRSKEPTRQCRRHRLDLWVGKIPWRRKWQPTPVFLPEKFCGQRSWRATVHGAARSQTHNTHTRCLVHGRCPDYAGFLHPFFW